MQGQALHRFGQRLVYRRPVELSETETSSARILTTLDLVTLGVDYTLGAGIDFLTGEVVSNQSPWTSHGVMLFGGWPILRVGWAVLCRVWFLDSLFWLCISLHLCHYG